MAATYTKLKSGNWGIRVVGSVRDGQSITVTKKSGETKTETVSRVVWSGNGITLAAIADSRGSYTGSRSRYSSHSDYIDSHRCSSCHHTGDECADLDCTCRTCGGMMR